MLCTCVQAALATFGTRDTPHGWVADTKKVLHQVLRLYIREQLHVVRRLVWKDYQVITLEEESAEQRKLRMSQEPLSPTVVFFARCSYEGDLS